jgi:hypothetical protein
MLDLQSKFIRCEQVSRAPTALADYTFVEHILIYTVLCLKEKVRMHQLETLILDAGNACAT